MRVNLWGLETQTVRCGNSLTVSGGKLTPNTSRSCTVGVQTVQRWWCTALRSDDYCPGGFCWMRRPRCDERHGLMMIQVTEPFFLLCEH